MGRSMKLIMVCVIVASLAVASTGTIEDDEKECAEQLTNLAACIPFVSGSAKKPTKECCDETAKVKSSRPKCLCVLIKESTDPNMGLPVNTTLALQMPSACNIDAKVSDCPSLLKLPPGSPDAKIFGEANVDSTTTTTTTTPPSSTTSGSSSSSTSGSGSGSKATPSSTNDGAKMKNFGSGSIVMVVAVACLFTLVGY
ncbi:hypothetical protein HHK36_006131 [Tetracentron sinense]|uniref:Bifunctional inhibitor/plant lipid transfer protein/seed storage helical domain-containing protein n=1 Tax=Tetracentron sinense TaxID=13715 RepID=A0A834ZGN7_TETSI|nr:hypothetical protein HHK36_006131 [Tetracentron sinense]